MAKTKKKKRVKKQLKRVISKSKVTKKKAACKKTAKKAKSNSKPIKNGGKSVKRNKNGQIVAGSGGLKGCGRPKGSFSGVKSKQLEQAIAEVEGKEKFNWLEEVIIRSREDTTLAVAILARRYPVLKSIEQTSFIDDSMSDEKIDEIRKKLSTRFED